MINTLLEDDQGGIWVGTPRGLAYLDRDMDDFQVVPQPQAVSEGDRNIVTLLAHKGRLIGATRNGQLLSVDRQGVTPIEPASSNDPGSAALAATVISSLASDGRSLYVGTENDGVYRLSLQGSRYRQEDSFGSGDVVVDVTVRGDTLIWLSRDRGLVLASLTDPEKPLRIIDPLDDDTQGYYRAMCVSSPDSAWFAAGPHVIRMRDGKVSMVTLPGRGNEVRSISVDRAGNIWVGAYYGLFYGVDTRFDTLRTAAAYDAGIVMSLTSDGDRLYLGGQDLWAGDLGGDSFPTLGASADIEGLRLDPLSIGQDPIMAMSAHDDLLLLGYFVEGFDVLDLRSGKATAVDTARIDAEATESIGVSAFLQVDERRWLATLFFYGLVEIAVERTDGAPRVSLRRIDDEATLIGLYRIDETRFLAVSQENLLIIDRSGDEYRVRRMQNPPANLVFSAAADGRGGIYVGIENQGIRHLSPAALDAAQFDADRVAGVDADTDRSTVWHLVLEESQRLWASTVDGLYVFDLDAGKRLSHFTYLDGLPSTEFEYCTHAVLRAANGEKFFATASGVLAIRDPEQAQRQPIELFWTGVTVDGESVMERLIPGTGGEPDYLPLPFRAVSEQVTRFHFGYNDHLQALNANYAIRFDDGAWLPMNLPSVSVTRQQRWGPIRIDLAIRSPSGQTLSSPLGVIIDVLPPSYMLWGIDLRYALPLTAAMAALLLTVHTRARRRQRLALQRAARELDLREAEMRGRLDEKEILLREIHHRVGNLLANFAATVSGMQRRAASDETRATLTQLGARIKVQSAVHQLLMRSDGTAINVGNMLQQVVNGACDLLDGRDTRPVETHFDTLHMTYSRAQYLGLILNELLTNSYKYASGGDAPLLATVSLEAISDGGAWFRYRDYGPGVPEETIARARTAGRDADSGLPQVLGLAAELKAETFLHSEQGLHFSLRLPATLFASG